MLKKAISVIALALALGVVSNVNAEECSYDKKVELNNMAAEVRVTYEQIEIDTGIRAEYVDPETGEIDFNRLEPVMARGFKIKVMNLPEGFYINILDDEDDKETFIPYYMTNKGTYEFGKYMADYVHNITITVGGNKDGCSSGNLRVINVVTPKYNEHSEKLICNKYPNYENCAEFITNDYLTETEFWNGLERFEKSEDIKKAEQKNKSFGQKIEDFVKNNKTTIYIIAGCILVVGVATTIVIIRKQRSRLI